MIYKESRAENRFVQFGCRQTGSHVRWVIATGSWKLVLRTHVANRFDNVRLSSL